VERAWLERGQGKALVRFAKDEYSNTIFEKVADGIIRNLSIGYDAFKSLDITKKGERIKSVLRTLWQPYELSFITVPADPSAQTRAASKVKDMERLMEDEETVEDQETKEEKNEEQEKSEQKTETEGEDLVQKERSRLKCLTNLCRKHKVMHMLDGFIENGTEEMQARGDILDEVSKSKTRIKTHHTTRIEPGDYEERVIYQQGVENFLRHRLNPKNKIDDKGDLYKNYSLVDMARKGLEVGGQRAMGMDRDSMLTRSLSTSDFPLILSNVANKELLASYETMMGEETFQPLVERKTFKNFKPKNAVRYGELGDLKPVLEGEEITFTSLSEAGQEWTIGSFARGVEVTRVNLINNDMDDFNVLYDWTRAISRLRSRIVYGLLKSHVMHDGKQVFHADHKNLAEKASMPDIDSFNSAVYHMSLHKGIDEREDDYIGVSPKFIIAGTILDSYIRRLIYEPFTPNELEKTNPYRGRFIPITDARLNPAPGQPAPWILAASPSRIPIIYVGNLASEPYPVIDSEVNKRTRGLSIYCWYDFGATIPEYRGLYKNPGEVYEL